MAKNPYIQFYIGDYIKDTRILPLNVRGAWVDLILFMWDNGHRGELTGTIEEFSRIMCCSIEEANLVIQTLKQKEIFSWEEFPGGILKIISRKQKRMVQLSQTRSKSGKNGGNPALLQANKDNLLKQKDKQNTEYEYENSKEGKGVKGEGMGWSKMPGPECYGLLLPEITEGSVIQFIRLTSGATPTKEQVLSLWDIFKKQNFTGKDFYETPEKAYSHFINWSKNQKINGTHHQQPRKNNKSSGAMDVAARFAKNLAAGGTENTTS